MLPAATGPSRSQASNFDGWEAELQRVTNVDRTSNGLTALLPHPGLYEIARDRSTDMMTRQYFSHSIPGGGNAADVFKAQGIPYNLWGENLGLSNSDDESVVSYLESQWLQSPNHRVNIMNPAYTHLGAGAAEGTFEGTGGVKIFTALFIQARTATTPPPAPTKAAPPPPPPPSPPAYAHTPRPLPPTHTPVPPPFAPATPTAVRKAPTPSPAIAQQPGGPAHTPKPLPPTGTFVPRYAPTQAPNTATPLPPVMTATPVPDTSTPVPDTATPVPNTATRTPLPATVTRTSTPPPPQAGTLPPSGPHEVHPPPAGGGRLFDEIIDRLLRGLLNF
jgi:hypothetical protein